MQDEVSIRHLRRDGLRTRDEVPRSGKRRQGERTKRWKNTRDIYKYSIGTDGFRVLCHQFAPSSLSRWENCLKSSKALSLKVNKPREALLLCGPLCWPRTPKIPRPRSWNWTNGWLVCAQKSAGLLDVDRPLSKEPAGGRLRDWGSEQKDMSAVVGSHCRGISAGALRNVFMEGLRCGDPAGATHSRGPARPEKRPTWSAGTPRCANDWPVLCA